MATARYWRLKNKDRTMQRLAEDRVLVIFNEFTKILEKYCKGSFENVYAIDQPLRKKSNKRLDFMMNIHQKILEYSTLELRKLKIERNNRI